MLDMNSRIDLFKRMVEKPSNNIEPAFIFRLNNQFCWSDGRFIAIDDDCLGSYFGTYVLDNLVSEEKVFHLDVGEENNARIIGEMTSSRHIITETRRILDKNLGSLEILSADSELIVNMEDSEGSYVCLVDRDPDSVFVDKAYFDYMKGSCDEIKDDSPLIYFLQKDKIVGVAYRKYVSLENWQTHKSPF